MTRKIYDFAYACWFILNNFIMKMMLRFETISRHDRSRMINNLNNIRKIFESTSKFA